MSRVDAAWKRADGERGDVEPVIATEGTLAAVPAPIGAAPVLDRYLVEESSPAASPKSVVTPSRSPRREHALIVPAFLRGKLVTTPEADPLCVEQFRRLAALLEEQQATRALRSIMVSSALPRDGKSLTVTNLALTLSETYRRRVLLLDADFHRPSIHEMFGLPNDVGLANALHARSGELPYVRVSPTLAVLPAGHAQETPVAALNVESLRALVSEMATRFDWIFLDSPPFGVVTDAQLIGRVADGVLLVVRAGATPYTLVQRVVADIGPERIVGTVLNHAEHHAIRVHDYYHRHYGARV